jgi:hypothetical protein
MFEAFSSPKNRKTTLSLFIICGVLGIAAGFIGIDDNLPGVLLAFLSVLAFILAFVHPWRRRKLYLNLIYASILGFVGFALLHNLFEFAASKSGGGGLLVESLNLVGGAFFLIAVLLCPVCLLVGVVGFAVMSILENHSKSGAPVS